MGESNKLSLSSIEQQADFFCSETVGDDGRPYGDCERPVSHKSEAVGDRSEMVDKDSQRQSATICDKLNRSGISRS